MKEPHARDIVERLRRAERAGASVKELHGEEARGFVFVEDVADRPTLLGSFLIQVPGIDAFFVSVVVKVRKVDDFQLFVMEKRKGSPVLGTSTCIGDELRWRYQPRKQDGDNVARTKAFIDANGSDTMSIPLPEGDVKAFAAAVRKALDAKYAADGGGQHENGATAATPQACWKIAPGAQGSDWKRCVEHGYIAVGWDDMGDLTTLSRAEFDERVAARGHTPGVEQLWKFRNIRVGDRIVANAGTTSVLGIGTVTGPYFFVAGETHGHRLPVRWDDTIERSVSMKGWRQTLVRLTEATFDAITKAPPVDADGDDDDAVATVDGGIDFDGILSQLETKSLSFSAETVAAYLLALQARRFVLLTGISGTGKTQLALEIARLFAPEAVGAEKAVPADAVELVVQPYHVKQGRFVVPVQLAKQMDALYDDEQRRIDVRLTGRAPESMALVKERERPNLMMVLLSGETKAAFQKAIAVGGRMRLRREVTGTKETLAIDVPGDAAPQPLQVRTHELVAVRPDWTDARALLGFYNPLTKGYVSTPTLDLLRRAQAEVERASSASVAPRPFFLIFDEMNLARVEHYFSDFLSAMESGEEIHLHDDDELDVAEDPIPKTIRIPKNLFVVGTVNIDETTYMFSPKVLDRAFVLEFNHVDLDALLGESAAEDPASTPLSLTRMDTGLKLLGKPDDAEWQRFAAFLGGELVDRMKAIHAALAPDNRHFGYRVAREIARFVDLAATQTAGTPDALRAAFDVAVLSKVLPKLHGGQAEIDGPLSRLFAIAIGEAATSDNVKHVDRFVGAGTQLQRVSSGDALPMPRTALKLWRMRHKLRAQGFVSFIE